MYRRQIFHLALFCVQFSVTLRKGAVSIAHIEKINVPLVQCIQFSEFQEKAAVFKPIEDNLQTALVQCSGSPFELI